MPKDEGWGRGQVAKWLTATDCVRQEPERVRSNVFPIKALPTKIQLFKIRCTFSISVSTLQRGRAKGEASKGFGRGEVATSSCANFPGVTKCPLQSVPIPRRTTSQGAGRPQLLPYRGADSSLAWLETRVDRFMRSVEPLTLQVRSSTLSKNPSTRSNKSSAAASS
jgi:hypothetical protein